MKRHGETSIGGIIGLWVYQRFVVAVRTLLNIYIYIYMVKWLLHVFLCSERGSLIAQVLLYSSSYCCLERFSSYGRPLVRISKFNCSSIIMPKSLRVRIRGDRGGVSIDSIPMMEIIQITALIFN